MTLPDGWREDSIRALLQIQYGKAHSQTDRVVGARFPVVGSAGEMARTNEALVTGPLVVIGRKGNVGQVHLEMDGAWPTDTTYFSVIPSAFEPLYLKYHLQALSLKRLDSSTATPSLRRQDLEAERIRVPPLDEQRRIVRVLDEQVSHLESATSVFRRSIWRSQIYFESVLRSVFATQGARYVRLSDLAEMGSGGTPSRGRADYYDGGTIPWAVIGDLKDGPLVAVAQAITSAGLAASSAKVVPPGSVLLAMYGSIGKLAVTQFPVATNQAIAYLVPRGSVSTDYLFWAMRSARGRLKDAGRGGTQQNISQTILRSLPVPVPPSGVQQTIVAALQEASDASVRLQEQLRQDLVRTGALRHALLTAAISGQLTGHASDLDRAEELVSA